MVGKGDPLLGTEQLDGVAPPLFPSGLNKRDALRHRVNADRLYASSLAQIRVNSKMASVAIKQEDPFSGRDQQVTGVRDRLQIVPVLVEKWNATIL